MVDDDNAVLELRGEVEGEARPWQARPWRWNLLQHVVHDVVAVEAVVLLTEHSSDNSKYVTITKITSYQVFMTLTFRKSRRGTLMPFVATSLKWTQSFDIIWFHVSLIRV